MNSVILSDFSFFGFFGSYILNINPLILFSRVFISNYILKKEKNEDSYINFGLALQKYESYKYNDFEDYAGLYITFFLV